MQIKKRVFQIFVAACFTVPAGAYADSWSCSHDNNVRELHIERPAGEPTPCEVVYRKLTEGVEDQVLWNAQNDDSYCEEQARGFIAKLESWGWVCTETIRDTQGEPASEPEAMPAEPATEAPADTGN